MRSVVKRFGRRGAALGVLGIAFLFLGLRTGISLDPLERTQFLLHTLLPIPIRVALWVLPGVVAVVAAGRSEKWRRVGFISLAAVLIFRTLSYLWSFVGYCFGATSWPHGWSSAIVWALLLALVLIIAGWNDVIEHPKHREKRGTG